MKKLMAIFSHPDDEGAMGGTLAHYAQQGVEIMLVCATRGEVGEISDPSLATPETLGAVRQQELEAACAAMGIQHLRFLDYRDSGMDGTPENKDPRCLVQADETAVRRQVVGLIRAFKPDIVVTFEPFGWYGHPDHVTMSRWATEAYPLAGDPSAYPEQGEPWQPSRLFHSVIPFFRFAGMMLEAAAAGYIDPPTFGGDAPDDRQQKTEATVTHIVHVLDQFDVTQNAMLAHKTQFGEDNMFRKIPREMMQRHSADEHFIQVHPTPAPQLRNERANDLFVGL
ncbi:MAG: PIG-L family deacetylase [Candidatus Promineifilaceae bacterium]